MNMTNKSNVFCFTNLHDVKKLLPAQRFKLGLLTGSIREIIAFSGLIFASSSVAAEAQINPNELWLGTNTSLIRICAKDIDQDGDLDIFKIFSKVVLKLENIGNSESPEFAHPEPVISYQGHPENPQTPGNLKLYQLDILGNCLSYNGEAFVDIDADEDLDLFSSSSSKSFGIELPYLKNEGTTEHPAYVGKSPQEEFGFPDEISSYMFKDIDHDGDLDFWSNFDFEPVFFENIGTPEKAIFVQRDKSPIDPLCNDESGLGFIVDLNNDGEWDVLCNNYEGGFEYFESSDLVGLSPQGDLFINSNIPSSIEEAFVLDIDFDGDGDILSGGFEGFILYTNFGTSSLPQYDGGNSYPFKVGEAADLDGDGDFDIIERETLAYFVNTGTNRNPAYEISSTSKELEKCNNSFVEIADANKADLSFVSSISITEIALVDIDGDKDLDLFSFLSLEELDTSTTDFYGQSTVVASTIISVSCENVGSATNPLFTSALINTLGPIIDVLDPVDLVFSDMDGDGDNDAWIGSVFYDNVGNSKQALFRHYDNLLFSPVITTLLDMDGDGRVDSTLNEHSRLLFKGLEPVTGVTSTALSDGVLVIATNRPSQVQLQTCPINYVSQFCNEAIALPETAKKLSLSTGDFTGSGEEDIVLAMIDAEGQLKIEIFNKNLDLIGSGAGGIADSVSVSTGQLDDDPEDEYVVSLVQADGRVAAIAFNLDGSRVAKVVANEGKQPSIDVGNFGGTGDAYVLAYLTPDDRLETAVLQGDGTLIGQGSGGHASHIRVTAAELSSSNPGDEYAISLVQSNGTVALISFAADGTRLGKVAGGISHQPKVISSKTSGLAVSVILSDKKPAIIFLDNQGKHLGTGVGGVTASVSTIELLDTDNDGIDDTGVLVYLDEAGNPRIGVYDLEGKKK